MSTRAEQRSTRMVAGVVSLPAGVPVIVELILCVDSAVKAVRDA